MPSGIAISEDLDLITGTLEQLAQPTFVQIAQTLNRFPTVRKLMRKNKVEFKSGDEITQTLMLDYSNNAYHTQLFGDDVVNITDVLGRLRIPWRITTVPMMWERHELLVNREPSKIVDLMKVRRADRDLSLATKLEYTFWNKPADVNDQITPYGVPMYIVKNATKGFNGGNPAGFPGGTGGIDTAIEPAWANWSDTFAVYSKEDFVDSVSEMADKTFFEAPSPESAGVGQPTDTDRGYYTTYVGIQEIKRIGEQQNENLGRDIDSFAGKTTIRGVPISWVPQIDSDTSNPFFQLDWNWIYPVCMRGGYMYEHEAEKYPMKHNTFVVWTDLMWNLFCKNRRALGVTYQV